MAVADPAAIIIHAWDPRLAVPRIGERVRITANEIQDGEVLPADYRVIDVVYIEERRTGAGLLLAPEHRVRLVLSPHPLPWHDVY